MSNERHKRAHDSAAESGNSHAELQSERGTLTNPEPTSGVVERATGLPANEPSREQPTAPQAAVSWDQRDTPELDLWADRTEAVSLLSPEEADGYADRIRPAWESPDWSARRATHANERPAAGRPLRGSQARAALEFARALSPEEADQYAARIRPAWHDAPAPRNLLRMEHEFAAEFDRAPDELEPSQRVAAPGALDESDRAPDFEHSVRARRLRGWFIAAGSIACFALFGVLAVAVPATRTSEAPATERAGLSSASVAQDVLPEQRTQRTQQARPAPAASPTSAPAGANVARSTEAAAASNPAGALQSPAAPASADEPAAAPTIRVRISAEPSRARIHLDGTRVENPFDGRMPAGVRRRAVIEASGYEARDFTLNGAQDERIDVKLVKRD